MKHIRDLIQFTFNSYLWFIGSVNRIRFTYFKIQIQKQQIYLHLLQISLAWTSLYIHQLQMLPSKCSFWHFVEKCPAQDYFSLVWNVPEACWRERCVFSPWQLTSKNWPSERARQSKETLFGHLQVQTGWKLGI